MFLFIFFLLFLLGVLRYSNTSHVPIYHTHSFALTRKCKFKYISCSYLSSSKYLFIPNCIIQIHLMFLFIAIQLVYKTAPQEFKYISCSYLSETGRFSVFADTNSNTSHVPIYHTSFLRFFLILIFKYISCSYLSNAQAAESEQEFSFKYISCSYLSTLGMF